MNFKYFCGIAMLIIISSAHARAQFLKLSERNERDMFILDTKATMPSGICYKEERTTALDPAVQMQTISYCCDGYVRDERSTSMKCQPICTNDCTNGICTAPDVCECYPGYERMGGRCEEQ